MMHERLFHISEEKDIHKFYPRPSPSVIQGVKGDVVFAITGKLLHHYLLPRDCPRIGYYATYKTTGKDRSTYLNNDVDFVLAIEASWLERSQHTTIYCYEFSPATFVEADACAGYYVSYKTVTPSHVHSIINPIQAIAERKNVELKILPSLWPLADKIQASSLNYSMIRMRNALPR
jgi:hypothetical protein